MGNREILAKLNFCRTFLHIQGFLTDAENMKVHNRIIKFQDKKRININRAQLDSVDMVYDDNAKDEDYE
jgi:hypothetical protein